jgi:uncharacterized BrkB/YihY/UPF0761 family membrane protein
MLFFYIIGIIFLFGAEINHAVLALKGEVPARRS